MKKLFKIFIFSALLFSGTFARADEGMWLLMHLAKLNHADMQAKGLKLTAEQIYSVNQASMKDAIVSFGGFCTGELISREGLILTNHHCGYEAIQSFSTPENDYLTNGYWAKSMADEKPVKGLFVRFLQRMEDVTALVLEGVKPTTTSADRAQIIAKNARKIATDATEDKKYYVEVKPVFEGAEFYLFVYKQYDDIRWVGAPPSSIGKFGGDTDNWMWPRHTGDFSMFRVYANKEGEPAEYSTENVPLKPKHFLPISIAPKKEGDFSMIMGFPGRTDRFLRSEGVKLALNVSNPATVELRKIKMDIIDRHSKGNKAVEIKYAAKRAQISNYWKYFIGQSRGIKRLKVYDTKVAEEKAVTDWINANDERIAQYGDPNAKIADAYKILNDYAIYRVIVREAIFGCEAAYQVLTLNNLFSKGGYFGNEMPADKKKDITEAIKAQSDEFYKDFHLPIDKDFFTSLNKEIVTRLKPEITPPVLLAANKKYKGDFAKYTEATLAKSVLSSPEKFNKFLTSGSKKAWDADPFVKHVIEVYNYYIENIVPKLEEGNQKLEEGKRSFISALRVKNANKAYYPDANSTLRLTYGQVLPYKPADAVFYSHVTTIDGVMEKEDPTNEEFIVPDKLKELYKAKDFGDYAENGTLNVGFLSNNDITGGNSGSPVINGKGELIGCAFDGNWEAMSGDIVFEPQIQRTISVDVRYVLWVIEKMGNAKWLIDEMDVRRN